MAQTTPSSGDGGPLRHETYRVRPEAELVRGIRAEVRALLNAHGLESTSVESLVLGLDEVLMNALEHSGCEVVELEVVLHQDRAEFEVRDRGPTVYCPDGDGTLPDDEAEGGRGLFLIHLAMDEVSFHAREGGGTSVRLVKRLA